MGPGRAQRSAAAALMPALPLDDAGPYVAAAYLVFLALILIYVAIMASKLVRISRDLGELTQILDRRDRRRAEADEAPAEETVPR
jgi:hypothetical protein